MQWWFPSTRCRLKQFGRSTQPRPLLQGYCWRYKDDGKIELLSKLQKMVVLPKFTQVAYILESLVEKELEIIKSKIKLEGAIRLFECKVEWRSII